MRTCVLLCVPLAAAIGCAHQKDEQAATLQPLAAAEPQPTTSEVTEDEVVAIEEGDTTIVAEEKVTVSEKEPAGSCNPVQVHFEFDSAEIPDDDKGALDLAAQCLQANKPLRVWVAGNTDDIGTKEYNLALGQERADAVSGYLQGMGVDQTQLQTISYGKGNPVCTDDDPACRAKNRHAAIRPACRL